jgi:hypothetical protein
MGRESSFSLYSFEAKRCACSLFLSNLEKKSCCHDVSVLIVLDDDQTPSASLAISLPAYFLIGNLYSIESTPAHELTGILTDTFIEQPPPLHKDPLYKILCSYTLYEEGPAA